MTYPSANHKARLSWHKFGGKEVKGVGQDCHYPLAPLHHSRDYGNQKDLLWGNARGVQTQTREQEVKTNGYRTGANASPLHGTQGYK